MFERRPSDSRIDLNGGLRIRSGFSSATVPTFAAVLRDTYLASEVWPLVNISAGTTVSAFINSARNGTETGWTLQNAAGPVTGTLAPSLDGVDDFSSLLTSNGSTGLNDIRNGAIGSFIIFGKVSGAGVWTDSTNRYLARIVYGGVNDDRLEIFKLTTNNTVRFICEMGAVQKTISVTMSPTGWFSAGYSWRDSANGDAGKAYANGVQVGTTQTGFGAWTGAAIERAALGTAAIVVGTPASVWSGLIGYAAVKFGSIWSDADFAAIHAAASTAGPDL